MFCIAKPKSPDRLGVNPLETLIGRVKETTLNNPPCIYHPALTSLSVHHVSHQWTALVLVYYNVT